METDYKNDLDALERACEEVLDAETLKAVVAAKRRIATDGNLSPAGNMATMYEALVRVKRLFDGRLMWQPDIRKAHEAVNAALAAPPRNCDRFGGDIDKLREACARERGLNPEEDFPDVFPDWLLAPSTAKESGVRK